MNPYRICSCLVILTMFFAAAARAHAQPPASNPIFTSTTGPASEPVIYQAVSLSTYEMLTGAFQFSDKDNKQKLAFAPFKLVDCSGQCAPFRETVLNFAKDGDVSTVGIGFGWSSTNALLTTDCTPPVPAAATNYCKLLNSSPVERLHANAGESEAQFKLYKEMYHLTVRLPLYDAYWKELAKHAWRVNGGMNVLTFGTVSGTEIDQDQDGKIDNKYRLKGYDLSAGFNYSADQAAGLSGAIHVGQKRASAVEGKPLVGYRGGSITAARRIVILDEHYETSEGYLKNLFIPSILVGASLELQRCAADTPADCDKNLRSQVALTPFLDFKIAQEAQFRLSFPISHSVFVGKETKTDLAPTLLFAVQLAGIK